MMLISGQLGQFLVNSFQLGKNKFALVMTEKLGVLHSISLSCGNLSSNLTINGATDDVLSSMDFCLDLVNPLSIN